VRVGKPEKAFVLLEVLVALVILSLGATAILQSLRQSLKASQHAQVVNTAALLAESLLEEVQVTPPDPGGYSGDFGEDFPEYNYSMTVKEERMNYRGNERKVDRDDLRPLKLVQLQVFHTKGQERDPVRVFNISSAVLGLQKFTNQALN